MEWFYAVGDKQMGPVNEEEFKRLAAGGTIRPDTLVWRAGLENWRPYREVTATTSTRPEPALAATSPTPTGGGATGSVVCRECGKIFPPEEVVKFGDAFVCATCKPVYVQRVREGVGGGGAAGSLTEAELLARDYDVEVGESISQGWEAFKRNAGLLIGASIVAYALLVVPGFIPFLGPVVQWVIGGAVMGGIWMLYIKNIRGEDIRFGDAFSGFGPRFMSLLGAYVVSSLLTLACMLPAALVFGVFMFAQFTQSAQTGAPPNISMGILITFLALGLPGFLAAVYLMVAWMFALPLVADKGLGFWAAMNLSRRVVNKHWWLTFALMIVCGLLSSLGALACLVGMLVTAPVAFGAFAWHYHKVFGDLAADNA